MENAKKDFEREHRLERERRQKMYAQVVREQFAPKVDEQKVIEMKTQIENVNQIGHKPKIRRIPIKSK